MRRALYSGFLLLALSPFTTAAAQTAINVNTLAQLRAVAATPDATITLAPGTYSLTGPTTRPSPAADHPIFLDLSGVNTTYVFTGVTLRVDTRELRGYGRTYGHADTVRVLQVGGAGATVDGLTLRMEHVAMNGTDAYGAPREYTADWSATLVELIADGVTVKNSTFTTGGSHPYGYGDAFGKGGRPADAEGATNAAWIDHRKHSGIRIGKGASGVTLEGVTLHMRTFGHGIFMQEGVSNITIRDCAVLGDTLASSDAVRAHPVYQQWDSATYGEKIPAGIQISRHEDAVRVYTNDGYETNGWARYVNNLTIERTRVERMRDAFATGDLTGALRVSDSESWSCEQGFTPSQLATENTFTACKGDAVNGPLVFFRRSATNVTMQVELAGSAAPVGDWPIALISGSGHTITLSRSAPDGVYPSTAYVNVSQAWREWRHRPATDIDASSAGNVSAATTGCTIINQTGLPLVFGKNATGNTATSDGGVLNKGSGNTYIGDTLVPAPITVTDTWGFYTVFSGTHAAANSTALGGVAADAGTRVASGGTLSIGAGLQFQGEPLTLAGTLSSPGAVNNLTRFNSNAAALIVLAGDAVMSVTGAANQFLVGPISGTGNLVKTGPGNLVMESGGNTFVGSLTVAEGAITARANKARQDVFVAAGASFRGQASLALNQSATDQTVLDGTLVVNARNDASVHTVNVGRLSGAGLITTTGTGLGTVVVAGESVFDGVIEGALGLTKLGAGTKLVLTGVHTYTGPTRVEGGVLAVAGELPAGTDLMLATGATLARDLAHGILQVASFSSGAGAVLRVVGAPTGFDVRRDYAWPVLGAGAITGPAPVLDATALPATGGDYALIVGSGVLMVIHTPAPYAAWQLARGIPAASSPLTDADGDGRVDLLQYALPTEPAAERTTSGLAVTFTRSRAELMYRVEASSDLMEWVVVATNPGVVGEPVTVADPEPASASRRFLRVRIE